MSKNFHIDINGKPAPCHAKSNCPRGGRGEHFDSQQEAQTYADSRNELKVEAEEILQSYYSGNSTLEEIGNSKNSFVRLEAYYNGYDSGNVLSEDYIVKKGLVENNLFTKELMNDSDKYIYSKAKENQKKIESKNFKEMEEEGIFSEDLSDKIKNMSEDDLEKMYKAMN